MADRALSRHAQLAILLVVGLALGDVQRAAAAEPAARPPAGHISVRGAIVNSNGDPQPGARVLLRAASAPARLGLIDYADVIAEATADDRGRFAFERAPIPAGMGRVVENLGKRQRGADVIVLADGYGLSWAPLLATENRDDVKVTLAAAATLRGTVTDTEGSPLTDAEVAVLGISRLDAPVDPFLRGPDDVKLYSSSLRPKTRTDAQGRFRIEGLPAECRVQLYVTHPDGQAHHPMAATSDNLPEPVLRYRLGGKEHEAPVQTNPIEVKLKPGLRLRVRVVDDKSDAPLGPGSIAMFLKSREWRSSVGADGTAAVSVSDPGEYSLTYLPPDESERLGMRRKVKMTEAHFDTPRELVWRAPTPKWLEGRVVGKGTETGLGGVTVAWSLEAAGDDVSFFARSTTQADGRFRVPTVPGSGSVVLAGDVPGYFIPDSRTLPREERKKHRITVDVPIEGGAQPLRLEVSRGLVVIGSVRDVAGAVVPEATVRATSLGRYGPRVRETVSDETGRFAITGLNPRESYDVSAVSGNGVALQTVSSEDAPSIGQPRKVAIELKLAPTVTLRGRVLHADKPLAKVRLELSQGRPVGEGRTRYRALDRAMTDKDGRYELSGLRPGDQYSIAIDPPFPAVDPTWTHQSPYIKTLAADAQEEVTLPDVRLVRTSQTLAGIVVDPDGNPVAGASVSARVQGGRSLSRPRTGPPPWTETGKDGKFRLQQLPDQPLELMAYIRPKGSDRRIRFPARVKCELNQQDIRILLDPSLVEED